MAIYTNKEARAFGEDSRSICDLLLLSSTFFGGVVLNAMLSPPSALPPSPLTNTTLPTYLPQYDSTVAGGLFQTLLLNLTSLVTAASSKAVAGAVVRAASDDPAIHPYSPGKKRCQVISTIMLCGLSIVFLIAAVFVLFLKVLCNLPAFGSTSFDDPVNGCVAKSWAFIAVASVFLACTLILLMGKVIYTHCRGDEPVGSGKRPDDPRAGGKGGSDGKEPSDETELE